MSDLKDEKSKLEQESQLTPETDFMREKIKERPVNSKKLMRKTAITAAMAVIFGLIACLTFLVLEPVISNKLYPEEEPETVSFPEETKEMAPEDMLINETSVEETVEETQETEEVVLPQLGIDEYQSLYASLSELAQEVSRCAVTVTAVTSDVNWINGTYESEGQTSGVIIADNGQEILILAQGEEIEGVDQILVTFCNDTEATATIKQIDSTTGLTVIAVQKDELTDTTKNAITLAALGSSSTSMKSLIGTPVIAIGSPLGSSETVSYGVITGTGSPIKLVDSNYSLITTNIYGSSSASGILVDLKGKVLGILDCSYNSSDTTNLLSAIGISELKRTIEHLSNTIPMVYFGIYGTDVTNEAHLSLDVPFGTYVTEIDMNSPAMSVGIQSGDVITKIGDREIVGFTDFVNALSEFAPEDSVDVTIMRQGQNEYREVNVTVTLQQQKQQ